MKTSSEPVFVDSSGRRRHRAKIAGAVVAVPALVYLVLLGSSVLGGPRLDTPLIPLPGEPRPQSEHRPKVRPTPTPTATEPRTTPTRPISTAKTTTVTDVTQPTDAPTRPPTVAPTSAPTTVPTAGPPTVAPTNPAATRTPSRGRPETPPGRTKSPQKP
ncbi:hypothetical protein FB561_2409 [Kribbella amoyensis]|uniref:Uncharacterized protein n=1 Tax=Kribbella amoyensis TaxID=996641 RepID=A0A561BQY9_9ACTN|nr:hypothetical protein [Kribbella amoyensis]TWD81297.1 hypothetical protein FB561_2409 [Kribbella amoyensis]